MFAENSQGNMKIFVIYAKTSISDQLYCKSSWRRLNKHRNVQNFPKNSLKFEFNQEISSNKIPYHTKKYEYIPYLKYKLITHSSVSESNTFFSSPIFRVEVCKWVTIQWSKSLKVLQYPLWRDVWYDKWDVTRWH